jgi:hypothetical protein
MKKLICMLLLIPFFLNAQILIEWKDVNDLFTGNYPVSPTTAKDTIHEQYKWYDYWGRSVIFYTISSDTVKTTLKTAIQSNRYKYADKFITFGILQDTVHDQDAMKDTMNVSLNMGVFRGFGFGSQNTTTLQYSEWDSVGFDLYNLFSVTRATVLTPDTIAKVSLKDSTWWTDWPVIEYYYEIVEGDTGKYRYFLNDFQFGEE